MEISPFIKSAGHVVLAAVEHASSMTGRGVSPERAIRSRGDLAEAVRRYRIERSKAEAEASP